MPALTREADGDDDDEQSEILAGREQADWSDRAEEPGTTVLCLEFPNGSIQEVSIELDAARSMQDVQRIVMGEWALAGGDRSQGLMMQYLKADGEFANVTRSVQVDTLKKAGAFRLRPKTKAGKSAAPAAAVARRGAVGGPTVPFVGRSGRRKHK